MEGEAAAAAASGDDEISLLPIYILREIFSIVVRFLRLCLP